MSLILLLFFLFLFNTLDNQLTLTLAKCSNAESVNNMTCKVTAYKVMILLIFILDRQSPDARQINDSAKELTSCCGVK
jgi:hypothetical protein